MEFTYTQIEISNVAEKILTPSASKTYLFYGNMGVGKTTLIKEIAKQLGADEALTSPSFSIVNEYRMAKESIYHFDFYRIENIEEVYDIGFEDYLDNGNFVFIEWPEKIDQLLPKNVNKVYIKKNSNGSRTLKFMPVK